MQEFRSYRRKASGVRKTRDDTVKLAGYLQPKGGAAQLARGFQRPCAIGKGMATSLRLRFRKAELKVNRNCPGIAESRSDPHSAIRIVEENLARQLRILQLLNS